MRSTLAFKIPGLAIPICLFVFEFANMVYPTLWAFSPPVFDWSTDRHVCMEFCWQASKAA
jgi:hypothetical protein